MGNTPRTRQASKAKEEAKGKTFKFSTIKAEAEKNAPERVVPDVGPFVLDDIDPPIVITFPDTIERQMIIGESMSADATITFRPQTTLPLLRALCGTAFDRVWMLVRDDKTPDALLGLIRAMFEHWGEALQTIIEAGELPGGSEGSSD